MEPQFIKFIGDVHGKYDRYKTILKGSKLPTIQVGDMGVGFRQTEGYRYGLPSRNPPYDLMKEGGHRFIRGNHDNPGVCKQHTQCISDGHIEDGVMFIGGAYSIDANWRVKDYTWWEDEELSHLALEELEGHYIEIKPHVMVTHTCPTQIANMILTKTTPVGVVPYKLPTRTEDHLQKMFEAHQPDVWVFGHWHYSFEYIVEGTRFICLDELETRDIDVS